VCFEFFVSNFEVVTFQKTVTCPGMIDWLSDWRIIIMIMVLIMKLKWIDWLIDWSICTDNEVTVYLLIDMNSTAIGGQLFLQNHHCTCV
jgi:hypothetical protein